MGASPDMQLPSLTSLVYSLRFLSQGGDRAAWEDPLQYCIAVTIGVCHNKKSFGFSVNSQRRFLTRSPIRE